MLARVWKETARSDGESSEEQRTSDESTRLCQFQVAGAGFCRAQAAMLASLLGEKMEAPFHEMR